jgi:putative nucleotidyltransferase with HDIG domain
MKASPLANLAQQEKTRREILHKSDLIPPLPELVVRLLALLNKKDTEPKELEAHLQNDQVLVAKMLAMVNSPFYGLNRSVTNIRDAIMVLGFRGLRSLILASSTSKFLAADFSCYGHDTRGLWKHALAVGTGARSIATFCEFEPDIREELFVAGLLHDVGKMLIAPYLNEQKADVASFSGTLIELELDVVGLDHTEAGALVAASWNLSNLVQEMIKHHHDEGTQEENAQQVAVVRLADAFAHRGSIGYLQGRAPDASYLPSDLEVLNLTESDWEQFCTGLDEQIQATLNELAKITS